MLSITSSKTQNLDGTPFFMSSLANTKAARGYEVRLYCQVINKGMSELYWNCVSSEGGDVTIGPDKNTNSALNRYVIDDSAAEIGHYNLIISRVRASDNGTCACLVRNEEENIFIRTEALLTVEDEASTPSAIDCYTEKVQSLVHDSKTTFLENETVTLTCISSGGVPLAYLQWEIVRNEGEPEVMHSSTRIIENTITAIANYTLTRFDNGAHFRCIQDHVLFPQSVPCNPPRGVIQPISVLYPPVLRFEPESIRISEEATLVTITCEYEAEPNLLLTGPTIEFAPRTRGEVLNYTYTLADQQNSMHIYVSKNDVGKKLTCSASNQIGESHIELIFEEEITTQESQLPILILTIVGGALLLIVLAACIVCCIYNCNGPFVKSAERNRQRAIPSQRVDRIANMEMSTERETGLHNYNESPNGTLTSQDRRDEPPSYINNLNSRQMQLSNGSATLPNSSRRERHLQRQRAKILEQRSRTTGRRRDDPPSYAHAQQTQSLSYRTSTSSNPQRGRSSRRTDSQHQHQNSIPRAPPPPSPSSIRTVTSLNTAERNKRQSRPSRHKQQRNANSGRNSRTSKDQNRVRVMPSSSTRSSISSNPPEGLMDHLQENQSVNMGYDSNEG